jgi:hypothetical protein
LLVEFIGALIVTNPGTDSLQFDTLFALVNAVMYGSGTGALRGMMATASATTLLMWQMVTIAVFPLFPADVRFPLAGAAQHRDALMLRRRQRDRATRVNLGAVSGAVDGSGAVLLSHAGVGAGDRLSRKAKCRRSDFWSAPR